MSSANVLTSAPPSGETQSIYPNLHNVETQTINPVSPQDFRLGKVSEIEADELAHEVNHYRLVGRKYRRARRVANWLAGGSDVLSTALPQVLAQC